MSINVKVTGINEAIKAFDKYFERKKVGLLGAVAGASEGIARTAKNLAPIDLGELKAEIVSKVIEKPNAITGDVLSGAPYSAYVEFGSKPHWTSKANLQGWADRHGIPVGAVQYSIAMKGTKPQPFMTPAAVKETPRFVKDVIAVFKTP